MTSTRDDLVELFDFVWSRFTNRMDGLADPEWVWCPTSDDRIGLRWRLDHIAGLLTEDRNWQWLGTNPPVGVEAPPAPTAADSLDALTTAFTAWRELLTDADLDLSAPMGVIAGSYAPATRRSFVLHVADELIHHTAEAALLRDLYRTRT